MRQSTPMRVYRQVMPWAFAGFATMVISGALLLSGFATAAYGNLYFRVKVAALLLAAVNAVIYHRVTERRLTREASGLPSPVAARFAALTSIALWMVVILAGRMMSYTLYSH
jgi:hypothetical protein